MPVRITVMEDVYGNPDQGECMFNAYKAEAEFAVSAVETAARLCRRIQAEMVTAALSKADHSPVTVADFASQAVVAHMFQETFEQETLVGEENSAVLREPDAEKTLSAVTAFVSSVRPEATDDLVCSWIDFGAREPAQRFWTLDPIDGTKGFLRGDQYVVALALIVDGRVMVGALGCPNLDADLAPDIGGLGSVAVAVRGQGAYARGIEGESFKRLQVSQIDDPAQARILRSYESSHTDQDKMNELVDVLGVQKAPLRLDSQAKYAVLAAGGGELLFRLLSPKMPQYTEYIWDQAAGSLIVEEAGGKVSDLRGEPLDFGQGRRLKKNIGVLVSNGHLHQAGLRALYSIGVDHRPQTAEN
jgi:3'(2'), 5'-bisphosphate nucleotidase